ncbi:diguanylate cyclase [Roseibium sp.]|uniref:GGDEF domain-containing response regulator n=1 Tax=Roseibium sp. TaxID=1936156 RepID=UPI003A972293
METAAEFATTRKLLTSLGFGVINGAKAAGASDCALSLINFAADPDLSACRALSKTSKILIRANDTSFEFKLKAADAGVSYLLKSPLDVAELAGCLTDVKASENPDAKILIVDDDDLAAEFHALALESVGFRVTTLNNPLQTQETIDQVSPDLVIMDVDMPEANGLEVARALRLERAYLSLPILFLSAEKNKDVQTKAREIGGDDFIGKPVDLGYLIKLIRMRVARALDLRQVMERDSLTGLLNHVNFKERLSTELKRSQRTGAFYAVALIDLDHFKSVNDTHGHQAGDQVIKTFANFLNSSVRSVDIIGRYGGEEFAVVFLDTTPDMAAKILDGIRSKFSEIGFSAASGDYSVTFSAGISGSMDAETMEEIIELADKALYEAKRRGRDRIALHSEVPSSA